MVVPARRWRHRGARRSRGRGRRRHGRVSRPLASAPGRGPLEARSGAQPQRIRALRSAAVEGFWCHSDRAPVLPGHVLLIPAVAWGSPLLSFCNGLARTSCLASLKAAPLVCFQGLTRAGRAAPRRHASSAGSRTALPKSACRFASVLHAASRAALKSVHLGICGRHRIARPTRRW